MDAIELLTQQHREVEKLFHRIEKAKAADKQELFDQVADALSVHAAIEEQHFYPAAKTDQTEELLREAVEEHLSVKRVLADLLDADPEDPQFEARIRVLQEQVQHHVEEEEKELFPLVRKAFSKEELEDLGAVMEEDAEQLAAGSPREEIPAQTAGPAPIE